MLKQCKCVVIRSFPLHSPSKYCTSTQGGSICETKLLPRPGSILVTTRDIRAIANLGRKRDIRMPGLQQLAAHCKSLLSPANLLQATQGAASPTATAEGSSALMTNRSREVSLCQNSFDRDDIANADLTTEFHAPSSRALS